MTPRKTIEVIALLSSFSGAVPAALLPLTRALRRYGMLLLMVLILTGGLRFLLDPVLSFIARFLGG